MYLVGGLKHGLFFYNIWDNHSQLTHIFQRGWNHQPVMTYVCICVYIFMYRFFLCMCMITTTMTILITIIPFNVSNMMGIVRMVIIMFDDYYYYYYVFFIILIRYDYLS